MPFAYSRTNTIKRDYASFPQLGLTTLKLFPFVCLYVEHNISSRTHVVRLMWLLKIDEKFNVFSLQNVAKTLDLLSFSLKNYTTQLPIFLNISGQNEKSILTNVSHKSHRIENQYVGWRWAPPVVQWLRENMVWNWMLTAFVATKSNH